MERRRFAVLRLWRSGAAQRPAARTRRAAAGFDQPAGQRVSRARLAQARLRQDGARDARVAVAGARQIDAVDDRRSARRRSRSRRERASSAERGAQEGARAARSRAAADRVRRRHDLGGDGGEARPLAGRLLARGDAVLLSAAGGGRHRSVDADAARGRAVSVGAARPRRADGLHGRVESVDLRGGADRDDRAASSERTCRTSWDRAARGWRATRRSSCCSTSFLLAGADGARRRRARREQVAAQRRQRDADARRSRC